jgi:Ni/Co efflux regulator RcnB
MFKTILTTLAATTMIASPLMVAQAQAAPHRETTRIVQQGPHGRTVVQQRTVVRNDRNDRGDYRSNRNDNRGNRYAANNHRWAKGQRFESRYASNYRVINNPRAYHLNNAPRGYHWVQSGNDAVLIAITSGIIGAVIGGALN